MAAIGRSKAAGIGTSANKGSNKGYCKHLTGTRTARASVSGRDLRSRLHAEGRRARDHGQSNRPRLDDCYPGRHWTGIALQNMLLRLRGCSKAASVGDLFYSSSRALKLRLGYHSFNPQVPASRSNRVANFGHAAGQHRPNGVGVLLRIHVGFAWMPKGPLRLTQ